MKNFLFILLAVLAGCSLSSLKTVKKLNSATAIITADSVLVSTGKVERKWKIMPFGLQTTELFNKETNKQWVNADAKKCDWAYYGLIDENSKAKLINSNISESTDSGFTTKHLLVSLEFEYPEIETFVNYQIRVYPDANGIHTQVGIKGKASEYVKNKVKAQGVEFKLISGKEKYDYTMHGYAQDVIANYAFGNEKIEYLIAGLDKNKTYKVGVSWWNFKGEDIKQSVKVTSVDGETKHTVFTEREVPGYAKKQKPEYLTFDLPSDVLLDGSFRLILDKITGENAIISEIWIQERGDKDYYIAGNTDRVDALRDTMPEGYSLAGYVNCGERNKFEANSITGRVDYLPVNATNFTRRYIGYYNDTQHRNLADAPLIKEEVFEEKITQPEKVEWASLLMVEDKNDVLIQVKESHKCVNQYGYDTGDFEVNENGIANTGTSLLPQEILENRYRYTWATWTIVGENTPDGRELAIKEFDRVRFPVDPTRDIYIQANTWGSGRNRAAASEENILKEIEVQAELGIDVQQIDDGWQNKEWKPKTETYPQGWVNVKEKAAEKNIKLGLWAAAMPVTLKQLEWNYDQGGFISYKLDFARLNNHEQIESMISKIRQFVIYTNHKVRVNWDVTENAPRYGYYWAREYGCVYLENRKPMAPENVVYHPYLVLRDLWHLSKYTNLNKFQGTVQNIDLVNKEVSDAYKHTHAYVTAIPLMSTPLFFQETQFYSENAKREIKPVLDAYKKVREDIYACYVYPIGEEPDNASWSGFQAHHPTKNIGFINLFREINNQEKSKNIQLRFLKNQQIKFTNLMTQESFTSKADDDGMVTFYIDKACDYRMYKYEY